MVEHSAAAVGIEAFHILDIVSVPHHGIGHARKVVCRMEDVVIAAGLVCEALPVQIHLQERLGPHPEQHTCGLTTDLIRHNCAAIKKHPSMGVIHRRTGPQAGLDAVALATGIGVVDIDDFDCFRL